MYLANMYSAYIMPHLCGLDHYIPIYVSNINHSVGTLIDNDDGIKKTQKKENTITPGHVEL